MPDTPEITTMPTLGGFLRARRARLTPDTPAGDASRRRTPGLRREEVAARANVSVTWYTWLEQGRGGAPSVEVLRRLALALELDDINREMLFLLAQQHPPLTPMPSASPVTPSMQRVLDAMVHSPALIKSTSWDVVAWNAAAVAILGDYPSMALHERNILRRIFSDPNMQRKLPDWEHNARWAVSVFRIDLARMGPHPEAATLLADMQQIPAFKQFWDEDEVGRHGDGMKRFHHPVLGKLTLEYASFSVDNAHGLTMIVFSPTTQADIQKIAALTASQSANHQAAALSYI